MPHFQKITDSLYQGSHPESLEQGVEFDIIINVSDSPCSSLDTKPVSFYKRPIHFWMPVNECGKWDYAAFYATKRILDSLKGKALIHCHAGAYRSVIIAYSWLYSNNQEHLFPDGKGTWDRFVANQHSSRCPVGIELFLRTMNDYPSYSLVGVLNKCKLPAFEKQWEEWFQLAEKEGKYPVN